MVRLIAIALLAQSALLHGQQPPETEASPEEPSARAVYAAAVAAAEAAREEATRDAEADYEHVAGAVRSAGASLTGDARRRLETSGPLVAARQTRDAALVNIEATYERALEAAARNYTPAAAAILSAVNDAVASVRAELGVYEAVMAVAAEALDSRQSAASGSAREAQVSESDYGVAVAARDEAQLALEAAESARDRIWRREPDYDSYKPSTAGSVLAGITAGLAEATGDRALSRRIQDGQASDRNQAFSSWEAARAAWETELAEADARLEAAREALSAAQARAAQAGTRRESAARSTRTASSERIAAFEAREAAKLDAAMVSTVLDRAELEAVEALLRKTGIAVIGELETEDLDMVTAAAAEVALRSALGRYGNLRPAALEAARAATEAEGTKAIESARALLKDRYQSQIRTETRNKSRNFTAAVDRAQTDYEQDRSRADQTLESALAAFQSLGPKKQQRPRNRATLQAALTRHAAATRAERLGRVNTVPQPFLASALNSELEAALPADSLATSIAETLAAGGDIARDMAEHRELRRHFDIAFRAVLLGEHRARLEVGAPERVLQLVEQGMESVEEDVAQRAASALEQLVDRIPHLVDRAEALRQLEEDVRNGFFRAAGSGSAVTTSVSPH